MSRVSLMLLSLALCVAAVLATPAANTTGFYLFCFAETSCESCVAQSGCGWELGVCLPGNAAGPFSRNLSLWWYGKGACATPQTLNFPLATTLGDSIVVYDNFEGIVSSHVFNDNNLKFTWGLIGEIITGDYYGAAYSFFKALADAIQLKNNNFIIFGGKSFKTSIPWSPLSKVVTSPAILVNYESWSEIAQTKLNFSMFMIVFEGLAAYSTASYPKGYTPGNQELEFTPITDLIASDLDTSSAPWTVKLSSPSSPFSFECAFYPETFSYDGNSYDPTDIYCDIYMDNFPYGNTSGNGLVLKTLLISSTAELDLGNVYNSAGQFNFGNGWFAYDSTVTTNGNGNTNVYASSPSSCFTSSWALESESVLSEFNLTTIKCTYFSFAGNNVAHYNWDPSAGTSLSGPSQTSASTTFNPSWIVVMVALFGMLALLF